RIARRSPSFAFAATMRASHSESASAVNSWIARGALAPTAGLLARQAHGSGKGSVFYAAWRLSSAFPRRAGNHAHSRFRSGNGELFKRSTARWHRMAVHPRGKDMRLRL